MNWRLLRIFACYEYSSDTNCRFALCIDMGELRKLIWPTYKKVVKISDFFFRNLPQPPRENFRSAPALLYKVFRGKAFFLKYKNRKNVCKRLHEFESHAWKIMPIFEELQVYSTEVSQIIIKNIGILWKQLLCMKLQYRFLFREIRLFSVVA